METLTYDADGNLKTDGRWTYTWDAADRLVKMESTAFTQPASVTPPLLQVTVPARVIEFEYDGLSRRIRKKVTEGAATNIVLWEAYVYDGWNMVLSVKLNPAAGASQGRPQSAIASYVWGPDLGSKPFARRDWQAAGGVRGLILANYFTGANGGGLHAPGMDAMGNVTSVTRLGVASTYGGPYFRSEFVYDYDAFGKEMRSSTLVAGLNPDSFPFHYSTKFTDPESGFNYYGYRFYDPANGRWINRNPIGECGGLNVYGMLGNDACNRLDALGLMFLDHVPPLEGGKSCPKKIVILIGGATDGGKGFARNSVPHDVYATHNEVKRVVKYIKDLKKCCSGTQLALIGHSWGGKSALKVAHALEDQKDIKIDELVTLDAVGRGATGKHTIKSRAMLENGPIFIKMEPSQGMRGVGRIVLSRLSGGTGKIKVGPTRIFLWGMITWKRAKCSGMINILFTTKLEH